MDKYLSKLLPDPSGLFKVSLRQMDKDLTIRILRHLELKAQQILFGHFITRILGASLENKMIAHTKFCMDLLDWSISHILQSDISRKQFFFTSWKWDLVLLHVSC
jgi:hypothetical protein